MNFDNYIPNDEMSILFNNKKISISSINKFEIDINMLQASYEVEVEQIDCDFMKNEEISIWKMLKARLKIGNFITSCEMTVCYQDSRDHTYCVFLSCYMNQNTEQFYNKICYLEEKQSRFEILDL